MSVIDPVYEATIRMLRDQHMISHAVYMRWLYQSIEQAVQRQLLNEILLQVVAQGI